MEIIVTHKNADFDAFASLFAAALLYPGANPVLPKALNPNVRAFLSIHKDHFSYLMHRDIKVDQMTKLIVVDVENWSRLEKWEGLINKEGLEIHRWDHHTGQTDIQADWSCVESVGSTTTLLFQSLQERGGIISPMEATLFLAGIYEDTGNLTFPSTSALDAKMTGFLLDQKADLNMIKRFLRPTYGPTQKDILFEMLKHAERTAINGYTVSINDQKISGHTPGLALVVDMYQDIMNVDAAFGVFSETKRDRCMVIGRSSSEGPNIGSIMRNLGGGGHPNAGSALLRSAGPADIKEKILQLIVDNQEGSMQIRSLMSYPVISASPDTTMKEAALILREKGCTGIPVVEGEQVVGVISRRDFKKIKNNAQMQLPVKAFMSTKVIHVNPEGGVYQAARIMVKHDIGRLPVLEHGKLIGIITRSDTMKYYYDFPIDPVLS